VEEGGLAIARKLAGIVDEVLETLAPAFLRLYGECLVNSPFKKRLSEVGS
jgi:hypothetical protein